MINNQEFTKRFARKLDVPHSLAIKTVQAFQDLVLELLEEDSKIKIGDFLVFEKKDVPEKEYRLPNSEEVRIKESYYKYSANLTDKYKKKSK